MKRARSFANTGRMSNTEGRTSNVEFGKGGEPGMGGSWAERWWILCYGEGEDWRSWSSSALRGKRWLEMRGLLEGVAFVLDGGVGGDGGFFEEVVALLEVLPEGVPFALFGLGHAVGGHAKGEGVDAEVVLAVVVGSVAEGVDFLDFGIGHGEATDRDLVAMDHECGAGALVGAVEPVGVAEVEGEVKIRIGVHAGARHEVESLGGLAVAFGKFGAEGAGHGGDVVGAEEFVGLLAWLLHPEL